MTVEAADMKQGVTFKQLAELVHDIELSHAGGRPAPLALRDVPRLRSVEEVAVSAFWQFLTWVNALSPGHVCEAVTQSTHSQVDTQNPILYAGTCAQAFLLALYSHGAIAWVLA